MAPQPVSTLGIALEAGGTFLSGIATVAQFAPVPYAQQVILLAQSILSTVQRVRSNKAGFQQLAKDIRGIIRAVEECPIQSSDMKRSLRRLLLLLTEIKKFALEHTSDNILYRVVASGVDSAKINDYRAQIRQALDMFGLKAQIRIHENTVQILKELKNLRPDAVPLSSDAATAPSDSTPSGRHHSCSASAESTPPNESPPLLIPPAAPAAVTKNADRTVGKFVNCKIGGNIMVTTINGDYTSTTVYR